jgi:hypothetical protein
MGKVTITLAVCIALVLALGAYTLTRSPPRVVGGRPFSPTNALIGHTTHDMLACQEGETLPADVSAVRLSIWAFVGMKMHVVAYRGAEAITRGTRGPDWTSDSVTVPVKPLDHATSDVTLCFALGPNSEPAFILGTRAPARYATKLLATEGSGRLGESWLEGKVGVEYLAAGQGSWWSRIQAVARHMGLGRAFTGTWIALLVALLMAAVGVLAMRLTLRELP